MLLPPSILRAAFTLFVAISLACGASAATVWSGPTIDFTKPAFGDPDDLANRDRIVPGVVELTRGDSSGLYNHALEAGYVVDVSPADTEWAFETNNPGESVAATNFMSLSFADWRTAHGGNPMATIGQNAVLHIVSADIYLDLTFTSFAGGGSGGGFSYTRATVPEPTTGILLGVALAALGVRRRGRSE